VDELWTFLLSKKKKGTAAGEGEKYALMACDPESKLWLSKHLGSRVSEDWEALFRDLASRLDEARPLPLITSDDWDAIKEALERVFSHEEKPSYKYKGRGRSIRPSVL
jgi:hypothetical protein